MGQRPTALMSPRLPSSPSPTYARLATRHPKLLWGTMLQITATCRQFKELEAFSSKPSQPRRSNQGQTQLVTSRSNTAGHIKVKHSWSHEGQTYLVTSRSNRADHIKVKRTLSHQGQTQLVTPRSNKAGQSTSQSLIHCS